ncbi:MAG: DUF2867 domain-containing protein [Nocardioidaceae bacterium]
MPYVDQHTATADCTPESAWDVVSRLGGDERIYVPRELWRARGRAERLVGGPGHRITGPGRALEVGDTMDFWEVVEVHPPTRLRVRALSLLPGTAYLDIAVGPRPSGPGTEVSLTTTFVPAGALGHVFWWSELPAHKVVFELMTRRLAALVSGW